ncbi:carboxypeptidase regulatory-like domain-containing protein [candidate division KSB1 bacterium]|nr:carboxypeptidase regulatory-like domain-containing protein [candidate division KSB1 bacterium]
MKRLFVFFTFANLLWLLQGCPNDNNPTQPKQTTAKMTGTVELPDSTIDTSNLTVAFGQSETPLLQDGRFQITGNKGVTGLAMVFAQDSIPFLLGIVPDPAKGQNIVVNTHSTALALLYLNPLVCVQDPVFSQEVIDKLEALDEFSAFESAIEACLSERPSLLEVDSEIEKLYSQAIAAYLNLFESAPPAAIQKTQDEEIIIFPGNIVGGLQIKHVKNDVFEIMNSYGRWAYAVTPQSKFWVFPNGDLLDAVKWNRPWAESTVQFNLTVEANKDPKEVNIYGIGWNDADDNSWALLNEQEKTYALQAGIMTVCVEFVPRIISVITNTSSSVGRNQLSQTEAAKVLGAVFGDGVLITKAAAYIEAGQSFSFIWELNKAILAKIAYDSDFRGKFSGLLGFTVKGAALKRLCNWLLLPLQAGVFADDLTGIAKTALGFHRGRFRTSFEIHKEIIEWGRVNGYVFQKGNGKPLEDIIVELQGDEDNPIRTEHWYSTDKDGGFRFENITTGSKTLKIHRSGYGINFFDIVVKKGENEFNFEINKFKYAYVSVSIGVNNVQFINHPGGIGGYTTLSTGWLGDMISMDGNKLYFDYGSDNPDVEGHITVLLDEAQMKVLSIDAMSKHLHLTNVVTSTLKTGPLEPRLEFVTAEPGPNARDSYQLKIKGSKSNDAITEFTYKYNYANPEKGYYEIYSTFFTGDSFFTFELYLTP